MASFLLGGATLDEDNPAANPKLSSSSTANLPYIKVFYIIHHQTMSKMSFIHCSSFYLSCVFLLLFLLSTINPCSAVRAYQLNRDAFPEGFVFDTAASAYQVEGMALKGGRGPSIWDPFVRIPGIMQSFFFSLFLHLLTYGYYPKSIQEIVKDRLPKFTADQVKMVKGSYDYIGLIEMVSQLDHR
ncbi:hypothetical protein BHE74_00001183 [Ensete ventricosum]|nr:hypothetical protein BHE74_00001183 [Ensete ventricosum]